MIRKATVLAVLLAAPLAVHGQGDRQANEAASMSARALSVAMRAMVQPDNRDRDKLFGKPAELGRFAMPAPAFVLVLAPGGCLTAAVAVEQIEAIDAQCLHTPGLPDAQALAELLRPKQTFDSDRSTALVVSPLFDAESVVRQFGGGVDFEPELAKLRDAIAAVRTALPAARIVEVTASF